VSGGVPPRRPALLALALLVSLTGASGVARANMAAVQRYPARVVGPGIARETSLRVDGEQLSFVCSDARGGPVCDFEARYTITNPSAARENAAVAFYGIRDSDLRVTIDGAPAPGQPSAAELEALDASVAALGEVAGERPGAKSDVPAQAPDRKAFVLSAEPGSRHQIVVTGRTRGGMRFVPHDYTRPAVNSRHLVVSQHMHEETIYDIDYLLAPIRTWKGDPRIDVRVTYPSRWSLGIGGEGSPGWARSREGDRAVLTRSMTAKDAAVLSLAIGIPPSPLHPGGPLLALGGTVGPTRSVRGRIGYEIAAPAWLLYSATFDTDFARRFIVTPLVEAASPMILIIPSFGLGLGVPVQIAPQTRAGARIQGDVHFFPIGFVTSVDIYPRSGSNAGFTEVSLLGQVGF
jgi:hypothetical protein